MYTHLHGLEPHVRAAQSRRLDEALKIEQLRQAKGTRQNRLATVVSNLRFAIGTLLITTGERIRREPTRSAATTPLSHQATGRV